MKLMIASDIHGSAYYCEQLFNAMEREGADRMLLLGDLLYHGPRNDLPRGYDPKRTIRMLNEQKQNLFCVRGNCDTEVDQMVLEFDIMAEYCLLSEEGRLIFATHGHHYHTQNPPMLHSGDILLHGHTHVPAWENTGTFVYLNPGSVSIPKENSPNSYLLMEHGIFYWKDLSGACYHTYVMK